MVGFESEEISVTENFQYFTVCVVTNNEVLEDIDVTMTTNDDSAMSNMGKFSIIYSLSHFGQD